MNYADKRKEFDQHNPAPTLFVRFPDSQTGHNEPVLKPRHSSEFDYAVRPDCYPYRRGD